MVGLESIKSDSNSLNYVPIIHLVGNDYNGIRLSTTAWKEFKQSFGDIDSYFRGAKNDLRDSKIVGTGWSLRFGSSHSDKAVEIEEEEKLFNATFPVIKKFRTSVIFKKVTFDRLYELAVCIENKISYLESIVDSVNLMVNKICTELKLKRALIHDTAYTKENIISVLNNSSESDVLSVLLKEYGTVDTKKNSHVRSMYDFELRKCYYELILLHSAKIIEYLNNSA